MDRISAREIDINVAASGDNTIIPAVAGQTLKIWQVWIVAIAAVNIKFRDGASDLNAFAVPMTVAGSALTFQATGLPWFTTTPGNAFVINLSGAVQITGRIYYTQG